MTKLGVLSTARINHSAIIKPSSFFKQIELYGVASRDHDKAKDYARKHSFTKAFKCYQDLVEDPSIDIVYISLPNSMHAEWIIKCIETGKHVLCEKPLVLSGEEISKIKDAMRSHVKVIEGLHYKYHPLMIQAKNIIAQKQLGEIISVNIVFNRNFPSQNDIRLNPELGGGCLWDLGIYCIDAVRFLFGTNNLSITKSHLKKNNNGITTQAAAQLMINDTIKGQLKCSFDSLSRYIKIEGSEGNLFIFNPFTHNGWLYIFKVNHNDKFWPKFNLFDTSTTYYHQLKDVHNLITNNQSDHQNNIDNSLANISFIEKLHRG
jgi:predicted dehydrogenase